MVKLTAQAAGTPWPIRLGERLTAFGNLSLALLLALLTGRLMELSGVLVTTEVPRDVGRVIVAALRSDLVLFLELLVFLLPLFLACRMVLRGKNADVRVYGGLGSLVLIGAVDPDIRVLSAERSEEHTSELQSQSKLVCRLLLEKKKILRSSN